MGQDEVSGVGQLDSTPVDTESSCSPPWTFSARDPSGALRAMMGVPMLPIGKLDDFRKPDCSNHVL
jgi:hypothetical protein